MLVALVPPVQVAAGRTGSMRKFLAALIGALALASCASTLQNAYDERARHDCERDNRGPDRVLNC